MTTIDVGLTNAQLYAGCDVEEVAGRLTLVTPPDEAAKIVGRNIEVFIAETAPLNEVTLTGPMAVWAYLIICHAVMHRCRRLYYADGRGQTILIAAHG